MPTSICTTNSLRVRVDTTLQAAINKLAVAWSMPAACVVRAMCRAALDSKAALKSQLEQEQGAHLQEAQAKPERMLSVRLANASTRHDAIAKLQAEGRTIPEIALELGLQPVQVVRELKRQGKRNSRTKIAQIQVQRAAEAREDANVLLR